MVRPESKSVCMRDDNGTAVLRIESPMGNIVDVISLFGTVVPELAVQDMWFAIEYALRPGENFLRIGVEAYREGEPQEAVDVVDMTTIQGTEPFIGILKGIESSVTETLALTTAAPMGRAANPFKVSRPAAPSTPRSAGCSVAGWR